MTEINQIVGTISLMEGTMTGKIRVNVPELFKEKFNQTPDRVNISQFQRDIDAAWETARDYARGHKDGGKEFEAVYLDTLARLVEYFGLEDDPLAVGRILQYVKDHKEENGSGN